MKHHEREFFVNIIRSGNIYIELSDVVLYVKPLTYLQSIDLQRVYNKAYDLSLSEGLMTEDEAEELMRDRGIWTHEEEARLKTIQDDLEKLKVEIYNNRKDKKLRESIRRYLRISESALEDLLLLKSSYYLNTCEGAAHITKNNWIIENNTYFDSGKKFDFENYAVDFINYKWREGFYHDKIIRELARNSPWRSIWSSRNDLNLPIFFNQREELLNDNQQNLLMWSKFYDNIQESMNCPPYDVIDDDDLLDGWMVVQSKEREKEKLQQEFEQETNDKIKNSDEIFVMSKSKDHSESIDKMNSVHAKNIKKQRNAIIQSKEVVKAGEFVDEQLKMQSMSNQQFKTRFKGG